jgi:hypothetical protein
VSCLDEWAVSGAVVQWSSESSSESSSGQGVVQCVVQVVQWCSSVGIVHGLFVQSSSDSQVIVK